MEKYVVSFECVHTNFTDGEIVQKQMFLFEDTAGSVNIEDANRYETVDAAIEAWRSFLGYVSANPWINAVMGTIQNVKILRVQFSADIMAAWQYLWGEEILDRLYP